MEFDLITLTSQVGFPIAVAAYVLIKLNASLNSLRDEVFSLSNTIKKMRCIYRDE